MGKHRRQRTPEQDALKHILACRDKHFLEERFIDSFKGRGLFTQKTIKSSSFVVEYRGNIFFHEDTTPTKDFGYTINKYLFEFLWEGAQWCIDASKEDGTLGRLVNDDNISPNCEIRTMVYEGKPHLCLFAATEICRGEEITYDYGDSAYPWRSGCEDSSAISFQNSCSVYDDDKEVLDSGAGHGTDGVVDVNSQMYFRENSRLADLGSSTETTGTFTLRPGDASYIQREDGAAPGSDEEHRRSEATGKPKDACPKNYCYVCGKSFHKVIRHLVTHAAEVPEIAEAAALPKTSKKRKTIMSELRNRGNYQHNQEVLSNNSGELKVKRRPRSTEISAKAFVHCRHCKGMYSRKEMWRHVARCPSRRTSDAATDTKTGVSDETAPAENPPAGVWHVLSSMKPDEISSAVQNDYLLMQLALYLTNAYGKHPSRHDNIRQQLREMGRLLLALHGKSISSVKDAIVPKNFHKVVEAVKDVAGFNEKLQSYNKPGLALRLGHSLKKTCRIVLNGVDCSVETTRDTNTFVKLCDREWSRPVFRSAGRKLSNPSTIPFTRDVQVFHRYLETTSASAVEGLEKHENQKVYAALCRVTLAHVSVLSKCAPEVSKMTLKTFQQREDSTQVLSKHFIRINIQSNSGRNVPVLVTSDLVGAITLLVSKRDACGVHKDNPFLFAKPDSSPTSLFHGANCIRGFSGLCHAKNPEHFRPTHLLKHIARVFQILNLENDELDHLAKLLGHNIRADRDYYRLPEAAVELAKISKLLLAMEKGSLEKFKGNSLEEIEIEDELEPDVEQDNPENHDAEEDHEETDALLEQNAVEQQGVQLTPEQDALQHIKARRDKPFLEKRLTDSKGSGVFTHESIAASAFVVEYQGNLVSLKETRKKKDGDTLNDYLFDFSWKGTNWRVDAAIDDGTLGRLVNDNHVSPNCEMKKVVVEGKPHLCLFAATEISPGDEITYDYGDSAYPWRSGERGEEVNPSQGDQRAAASSPEHQHADDEDYVPSGSDDDDEPSFEQQPIDASFLHEEEEDDSDHSADEATPEGKVKRRSKNYCYVCGTPQTKISRHLFTHRNEEPDIYAVWKLRKNSKQRKGELELLRNRGNNMHNEKVLQTSCGELKLRQKHSRLLNTANAFTACLYCKNMYNRKLMFRHVRRCPAKLYKSPVTARSLILVATAESTDPQNLSLDVETMLSTMKKDEISSEIWKDSLLLQLAQCYYSRRDRKGSKGVEWIKLKLRQMGRLLLALKEKSVCGFNDAVKLQNFSKLVEAVRAIVGFDEEKNSYTRPSYIRSFGISLVKIAEINFARALRENAGRETRDEANAFMQLCAKEWNYVRPPAASNNTPTVPFINDVQLFYQLLEKTAASAVESLTLFESPPVYGALLRVTVAQVSVLNKDMARVSQATLESFQKRDEAELQDAAGAGKSQFEQILSKPLVRINVVSNGGRKVSLTLTGELLAAITLLASKRGACGVHEDNPFLFGVPQAPGTSDHHAQRSAATFVTRCGAKNRAVLRSPHFHKHVARFFQILGLAGDELERLAALLGRDIPTDRGRYRAPEAAGDIAKISELLSALENGSLERFEGKSFEEIEIPDELEPDVEQVNPEIGDNGESESSPLMRSAKATKRNARVSLSGKRRRGRKKRQEIDDEAFGLNEDERNEEAESEREDGSEGTSPRGSPVAKDSFSETKRSARVFLSGKRRRGRKKKQECDDEASGLKEDEIDEEAKSERAETPPSRAVVTPEETLTRGNEDATNVSFSDGDEDMNVDFDMESEEDVRNEGYEEDAEPSASAATPLTPDVTKQDKDSGEEEEEEEVEEDSSPSKRPSVADRDETETMDAANSVEKEGQKKVDREEGKKNKLSAGMTRIKEVKISIPKLDIEKFKAQIHNSKSSSECRSVRSPVKDPVDKKQLQTSSRFTKVKESTSYAKVMQMICSHCRKGMAKGQTAFQKKGYTDVFCSKNCLFEMFPITRLVAKTCHCCLKAISQPLDLIMAAVDVKGTMKDFCSPTCLLVFKSSKVPSRTTQRLCSMCSKACTTMVQLTVDESVCTFCSNYCLDNFRRDNVCEHCSSTFCHQPLKLELEEAKTMCSQECLHRFKEKIKTRRPCPVCHARLPVSDMVDFKSGENAVELFCSSACVTAYSLQLTERNSTDCTKKKGAKQTMQTLASEKERDAAPPLIPVPWIICCNCGKKMIRRGKTNQTRSAEAFCSDECRSEKHPNTKSCYNCFQAIVRLQSMILAPVDDSGVMRELCSATCLASVNSKRKAAAPKPFPAGPRSECRMCRKFCNCKFHLQKLCSNACFINYHRANKMPLSACDVCSSLGLDTPFTLKAEDGSKALCSEECLVKLKEQMKGPRLCPMCQTPHQLSDMVENINNEGMVDFFCSNRCMLVHNAQSTTVSERNSLSLEEKDVKEVKPWLEENDVKEVKPVLPGLDCIKEEPVDEEYSQNLPSSISTDIKDEPKAGDDVVKEDLKISSVFSMKADSSTSSSTSTAPAVARLDMLASCFNCKRFLMDKETIYQRKGHADIFCSTPCLLKFYQMKPVSKTCHFCLQEITQLQVFMEALVDNAGTKKDFCSQACLSSFNYKRIVSTQIPLVPVASQSQCSMCSRYCISKHEVSEQDVVHKMCSDPCLLRYCAMNKLSVCENCRSCCAAPLALKMADGCKKLCDAACLAQFKRKIKTPQPCSMCRSTRLMTAMLENRNGEGAVELFCSSSCVMASKIQAVGASGAPLKCDQCDKTTLPACHLAMSDASIRNFCSLTCAMSFKEAQKDVKVSTNPTGAAGQSDFLKPPEKLPCAQCQQLIKVVPKVVQRKGEIHFVCSLSCCEAFKTGNNIKATCEYCKEEKISRDVKKVDGKVCFFCSDDCKVSFRQELKKQWGEVCGVCAYCLSISKTRVMTRYKGTVKEFCSDDCSANYNALLCRVTQCDTCGRSGRLKKSLPLLGEVKRFCGLRCVLHFCNKKVQMVNSVSSPPRSSGTVESLPIIANVMSLASTSAMQPPGTSASSPQLVSAPDIQTKVVGHAGTQTVPTELKNKSTLCTPLVHNKGVSCTTRTVDTETQTDNFVPDVVVLPVPMLMYVPLPMNMYSQYVPTPVCLPLPLPVPVFLPNPTVKSAVEEVRPHPLEEELSFKSEMKSGREDGAAVMTTARQRQESHAASDHSRSPPPPPPLPLSGDLQSSPAPPPSRQTAGKVHDKNKGRELETGQREEEVVPRTRPKLKSQCGVDAWKRWIQWRGTQTNLISSDALALDEDVLRCSASELSAGLCRFISEVTQPDGEPHSADGLFYLCLSIQQYLLDSGRQGNIFSDLTYNEFATKFTNILKGFKPSAAGGGYIHSRVEEGFLWDCRQLGAYSPIVLLNTLLFFCCKYFGFTTVEQHRQLSFAHVMRCTKTNPNNTKTSFLRFYPPSSMTDAETDADGVPAKRRKRDRSEGDFLEMVENTENPLRCPVRLYEFYLSKCAESVKQRTDLFYLLPHRHCVPSSSLWFSSTPLDGGTMEAMLVRSLAVRELRRPDAGAVDRRTTGGTLFVTEDEDEEE
ncbi:uncharacterized protein [Clinocottus analis]|uniref:uncharacterized protein isoform X2 n=1 Tax=Clinocottus analis TaxID=304258 RepID=UPI0035BEDC96